MASSEEDRRRKFSAINSKLKRLMAAKQAKGQKRANTGVKLLSITQKRQMREDAQRAEQQRRYEAELKRVEEEKMARMEKERKERERQHQEVLSALKMEHIGMGGVGGVDELD